MYLVIAIISKMENLNNLLLKMHEKGFTGGTLLDSVGMQKVIPRVMDKPLVASLHSIFDKEGEINKTLLCVVDSLERVNLLMDLIEATIGDFDMPHTAFAFSLKIDQVQGFRQHI